MSRVLYASQDNHQLYLPEWVDGATMPYENAPVEHYTRYEVSEKITLTPDDLCVEDGSILEMLLRTQHARPLDELENHDPEVRHQNLK
jgi:hypothetical protein